MKIFGPGASDSVAVSNQVDFNFFHFHENLNQLTSKHRPEGSTQRRRSTCADYQRGKTVAGIVDESEEASSPLPSHL